MPVECGRKLEHSFGFKLRERLLGGDSANHRQHSPAKRVKVKLAEKSGKIPKGNNCVLFETLSIEYYYTCSSFKDILAQFLATAAKKAL